MGPDFDILDLGNDQKLGGIQERWNEHDSMLAEGLVAEVLDEYPEFPPRAPSRGHGSSSRAEPPRGPEGASCTTKDGGLEY